MSSQSTRLDELLKANHIDLEEASEVFYDALLVGLLDIFVKRIEKSGKELELRDKYRKSRDHLLVTRNLVYKVTGTRLDSDSLNDFHEFLMAYLSKSPGRIAPLVERRNELLAEQDYRCESCKKPITVENAHYDHVVPFKLVGDALKSNAQMLCEKCNFEKGASPYFALKKLLISKE